jgi:hypothetical protein
MTESVQALESRATTRRALLFGGLGAAAAMLVNAIAGARPVFAANGDAITVGGAFTGTAGTSLVATGDELGAFTGQATGSGSVGVTGSSTSTGGVPAGVFGNAMGTTGTSYGVLGRTRADHGIGVGARAVSASGPTFGVNAVATSPNGIGVYTEAAGGQGVALRAVGRVRFSTSGIATIAKGTRRILVNPRVPVSSATKVLCTLLSNPGGTTSVQRVQVDAAADRFTIYLTANATAATKVAWFAMD